MKTLISFIGNSDPVRGDYDGPMLHIARHYKPHQIYLLLTKRMQKEERKTLILASIRDLQKHINQDISVSMIHLDTDNPAKFKNFGFTSILDDIIRDRQSDEFFINITSGTTQMIAAMCLEVVTNNRDFRTIQVLNPNPNQSQELKYNEFDYQFDNNLDNLEEAENRCVETDIFSFKIAQQKQILQTKISRYDYDGALETANSRYFKETDIKALVEFAYYCDKLRKNVNENIINKYGILRSKASDFVNSIMHYYLSWRLEYLRQDYINTLLRMTPLFFEVLKYALLSKGKSRNPNFTIWRKLEKGQRISEKDIIEIDPSLTKEIHIPGRDLYLTSSHLISILSFYQYESLMDEFISLREIEESSRNQIAHQIDIAQINLKTAKNEASQAVEIIKKILEVLFKQYLGNINFNFFEDINEQILKQIKEIEE